MKKTIYKISTVILLIFLSAGCSDFQEINQRPDAFTSDEVSAKYFLTGTQIRLYAPDRYPYWRAQLIHADRFAGQITFGMKGSWWNDGLGYNYSGGYTNAEYGWISGYNTNLSAYMSFVQEGGDLENERYFAIGLIMKGLYYQMFTDIHGMIPFKEASDPGIITPVYDTQADIYSGIIADLDQAMEIIGDNVNTGDGIELLGENDLFFGGDLQKWKKLANSLKLRLGLRALGAPGADFAKAAISQAMGNELLVGEDDNALMEKDIEISQWANAAYGDVWRNFGGLGSKWNLSESMVANLRDNNDPRLSMIAKPTLGYVPVMENGEEVGRTPIVLTKPADGSGADNFDKYIAFIDQTLDEADVVYTSVATSTQVEIMFDYTEVDGVEPVYYVGQPTRLNGEIQFLIHNNLFSEPTDIVTNAKNQGNPIFPEIVFTAAEGNFLKAEAIVRGEGSGSAETFYQEGIRQAMKIWGVDEGAIENFIANEDAARLNGSDEENFEKISIQRWLAAYTDGFEAWAIVRDSGYPSNLAAGVSDADIFALGDLNGKYPQRMRYGSGAYNSNGENTEAANAIQGPDVQATDLWWAKQ